MGGDDFTVRSGAADAGIMGKQIYAERLANELGMPLVRLIEGTGGGGSVKMLEQHGFTHVPFNPGWDLVVDNLSAVPVVSACLGPVAGLGAARAVMSHFCILVEGAGQLFVAGPPLVKHTTGEDPNKEELGGAAVHRRSGAVDVIVPSEEAAFQAVRDFLAYLPSNVDSLPPVVDSSDDAARRDEDLISLVPRDRRKPYRLRPLLNAVFDAGSVFDYACYGGSAYAGLARLDGHPVGVIATDPYRGATLTAEGADAITRLVDLCETFHLPIVNLTDQAGMVIGLAGEKHGSIRRGARAITAVYQARVPVADIIVRRVFGAGGAGITNRHRLVRRWAWPSGDWGSLPVEGASKPPTARKSRPPTIRPRTSPRSASASTRCGRRSARPRSSPSRTSSIRVTRGRCCASGCATPTGCCRNCWAGRRSGCGPDTGLKGDQAGTFPAR